MKRVLLAVITSTVLASSCTRARPVPVEAEDPGKKDDRIRIEGSFHTTDPETLKFPVKVLFVVDKSQSMDITDPQTVQNPQGFRGKAVTEAMDALFHETPGIEFAVISFGAATAVLTERCDNPDAGVNCRPGFTGDITEAISAGQQAGGMGGGVTDYISALTTTYTTLFKDMSDLAEDDAANARYVVIFLSDGIPDVDNGRVPACDEDEPIMGAVQDIADLKKRFRLRELTFNTLLMANPSQPSVFRDVSRTVLNCMAHFGNGVFRDVANGGQLNFLQYDFTSYRRTFTLKNLIVTNFNAHPGHTDEEVTDSDGDGLTDEQELQIGSDPTLVDTDGDFFNDLLEHQLRTSGLDPLDPTDADCGLDIDRIDTDGDGLRDCEERFIGTRARLFDTEFDGVPDLVEVWFNTLVTVDDLKQDLDFDGSFNGDEVRWHSNPRNNDSGDLSDIGYRIVQTSTGPHDAKYEYTFNVSNIRLASTLETPGGRKGRNRIFIYVTEVPQDDPGGVAIHRVACATARYIAEDDIKDPPNGVVKLTEADLHLPTEFNPDMHCIGR